MKKYRVQLEVLLHVYELLHNTLEASWTTMTTQVNSRGVMCPRNTYHPSITIALVSRVYRPNINQDGLISTGPSSIKVQDDHGVFSAIICPWLDVGLPPRCPQVVWCHWGEIEPISATLAQDGLAECDKPGKKSLEILNNHRVIHLYIYEDNSETHSWQSILGVTYTEH